MALVRRRAKVLYIFEGKNGHHYLCGECGVEFNIGDEVVSKGNRRKGGSGMLHKACFVDAHGEQIYK